jgi:hypothetical protein
MPGADLATVLRVALEALNTPRESQTRAQRLIIDTLQAGGPPPPTSRLPDRSTGYAMRRTDDCLQAAVATCLEIPMSDVPDSHIDDMLARGASVAAVDRAAWEQLTAWLASRGLAPVEHDKPPTHLKRWIGIVPAAQAFQSHSLVMAGTKILFDPAVRPGVKTFYPWEVTRGLSFTSTTKD